MSSRKAFRLKSVWESACHGTKPRLFSTGRAHETSFRTDSVFPYRMPYNLLIYWRSQRDSNPRTSLERAVS